jgi:hypothetical protein
LDLQPQGSELISAGVLMMNKFIFSKRFFIILGILLATASQSFIIQAQTLTPNKTGRSRAADSITKEREQTSFMFDGTVNPAPGNPTCRDLSPFYHELKIDPPKSGNYSFAVSQSLIANLYGGEDGLTYFDYQSTLPLVAVIVKGGNQGANVYTFNSGQTTVSGLTTPNLQDISHISLCYVLGLGTTAAPVSVSGRVTDEDGRGIGRAMVMIQNLNTEETRTVITNWAGNYRFRDLPVGDLYVVTITNKRSGSTRQTQSLILNSDEENLNFTVKGQ